MEFALVIAAMFVMARTPVLFLRQRTSEVIGSPIAVSWMDDHLIRGTFLIFELLIVIVALRVCDRRSLVRQWPVALFLGLVVLSTLWSVEPGVTSVRSSMFVATAAVGWYLGERFTARQQAFVVSAVGGVGAILSVLALWFWPDLAMATDGYHGLWSGVYVHRNLLGLAMSTGLLALLFLLRHLRGAALAGGSAIGLLEVYLFWRSGSRTGMFALAAAGAAVGFVAALRVARRRWGVSASQGAMVTLAAAGLAGYCVDRTWVRVVSWFGRDATLSSRATVWAIVRQFVDQRPVWGWGFEAFWSHPVAVEQAAATLTFAHAHSAYYEILLGTGAIGFGLFVLVLMVTAWRAFACAWHGSGTDSLWPLGLAVFIGVTNVSESFVVANDGQWALLVSAGVTAARTRVERKSRVMSADRN